MIRPRTTEIPNQGKLRRLVRESALKGRALVTEVVSCPAFALVLNKEKSGNATISFAPTASLTEGGREVGPPAWNVTATSGTARFASDAEGRHCYYRKRWPL
jgi:hypothetical protein